MPSGRDAAVISEESSSWTSPEEAKKDTDCIIFRKTAAVDVSGTVNQNVDYFDSVCCASV